MPPVASQVPETNTNLYVPADSLLTVAQGVSELASAPVSLSISSVFPVLSSTR